MFGRLIIITLEELRRPEPYQLVAAARREQASIRIQRDGVDRGRGAVLLVEAEVAEDPHLRRAASQLSRGLSIGALLVAGVQFLQLGLRGAAVVCR